MVTLVYRAGSMTTVAREIPKCKLVLVGAQVRCNKDGTEPAGDTHFSIEMGMRLVN
jgi:hypothetical protein